MKRVAFSILWFVFVAACAADAYAQALVFSDGFEDGTTSAWSLTVSPDPPGTMCADAADISAVVFPYQLMGTFDDDPPTGPTCDISPTNTVWYTYTPSFTGEHEILATNHTTTKAYSRLAIFEGTSCTPYGAEVDCQSDTSTSVTSTVALNAGTSYLLMFFTDGASYTMVDPEITISEPTEGADLELMNLMVSPSAVTDRQFTSASFVISNNGPEALSSEWVLVEYYLSNDTTFGDSDDRKIGDTGFTISIPSGGNHPIDLSAVGLTNMTRFWSEGLVPAGNYYVYANVSLAAAPPTDPNLSNNFDRTNSAIAFNLADISLTNFMVSPSAVTDRQFTSASFVFNNNGPVDLSYEWLLVEYYLSNDTTFGDSDDRKIGDTGFTISIPSGGNHPIDLSAVGLTNMTRFWSEGLVPAGNYYVYANVSLPAAPPTDPNSSNNFDRTDSTIAYNLADIALTSLAVLPTKVTNRQFTSASFVINNNGPVDLSYEWVLVEYYLSTNTVFGDKDDRKIGDTGFTLSMPSGGNYPIDLSSIGLANMTRFWTERLVPAGSYYVFAYATLQAPPPNDPTTRNNVDHTTFAILYQPP
jgi:hypothetical protein